MGFDTSDDACVYKLSEDLAIIQTVDFFPPIVDDPYMYGQIAAANALSDIYAMGAEPSLALNILCFPTCLPLSILKQIMAGGNDKVNEAGASIAGGHSLDDPEPKYGLSATAFIHPDKIWSNATSRPGDRLVLTKALGSGLLSTAAKAGVISQEEFRPAIEGMAMLNKYARDAAAEVGINACTDITGFGFIGHAGEMARASNCSFELSSKDIPVYPKARELAREGIIPEGTYRNRSYSEGQLEFEEGVPLDIQDVMFDPQTSGGLLLSVAEEKLTQLLKAMTDRSVMAAVVGQVSEKGAVDIYVKN